MSQGDRAKCDVRGRCVLLLSPGPALLASTQNTRRGPAVSVMGIGPEGPPWAGPVPRNSESRLSHQFKVPLSSLHTEADPVDLPLVTDTVT